LKTLVNEVTDSPAWIPRDSENGTVIGPQTPLRDIDRKKTGFVRASGNPQVDLKTRLVLQNQTRLEAKTLLNSGCTRSSIDVGFARRNKLPTIDSLRAIPVRNADGSINGYVKKYVETKLEFTDSTGTLHSETIRMQVINLGGKHDIFLGYDWFEHHNLLIDWRQKEL